MPPTIRPARPEEYDRIGRIVVAAYDTVGMIEGDYRAFMADTGARVADGAEVWVTLSPDGEIAGTVTFTDLGNRHHEHGIHADCGFRLLGVDPALHGQGYGRALVQACLDTAAQRGRRRMLIYSMEWMRPAHRLYTAMGFTRRHDRDVLFPAGIGVAFQHDLVEVADGTFPPPGPINDPLPWYEDFLRDMYHG